MEATTLLRKMITKMLSEDEFDIFCQDYFKEVCIQLGSNQGYMRRAATLVNYCDRRNLLPELARQLQVVNPQVYLEYHSQLQETVLKIGHESPKQQKTIEHCLLRIYNQHDKVVGAGFILSEQQILTCAHVVRTALAMPQDALLPDNSLVSLDFPLIAPQQQLQARLASWNNAKDLAFLYPVQPLPTGTLPANLEKLPADLWGHEIRAFGFPTGYDQGVWCEGKLLGKNALGWVQIQDTSQRGYFIQPGFSGAPVWDDVLRAVVGMVVAATLSSSQRAGFLIPVEKN